MQNLTSLFFPEKPRGKIGTLTIDATVSENHKYDTNVTSNPVEDGEYVSDHIYNMVFKLSLSGVITDTPFNYSLSGYSPIPTKHDQPLSKQAYSYLLDLRNQRTVFTVVTGLQVYENMAFENITFARDADTGKAVSFTADLIQINKVNAQEKSVNSVKIKDIYNSKTQGTTTNNQGSQRTSEIIGTEYDKLKEDYSSGVIYSGGNS